jgi:polyhydroxyalkanoate synthase subunit PhaC
MDSNISKINYKQGQSFNIKSNNLNNNQDLFDYKSFDRLFRAFVCQYCGIYPAFNLSLFDWLLHFSISPFTQIKLAHSYYEKALQLLSYFCSKNFNYEQTNKCEIDDIINNDKRFKHDGWKEYPFNVYLAAFLLVEKFGKESIDSIYGTTSHHKLMNHFAFKQWLNIISPINNIYTNPEIGSVVREKQYNNFIQGWGNFVQDFMNQLSGNTSVDGGFAVGKNLAITPGKIIYKNDLIELIQYTPSTNEVYKEPILIVPACIMKYYILDLSSHNSLVKYLVSKGHTVFMISWKNPNHKDSNLCFDDYINKGVISAIDVISSVIPKVKIHAVGYCLGGTMLAIAAAYMAQKSDNRLQTITLLAAQTDFKSAGELMVFIDESQLLILQDIMWKSGFLCGSKMASAFNIMHSADLIWGKIVQDYFIGERKSLFDVMAWNKDVTRLPYKMHSEYLEKLFLNNSLVDGDFAVNKENVFLYNINVPIFAVGTVADHVAPWKSVYKINFLTKVDVTFVLTTGGHNVGIVSEPGNKKRSYQVMTKNSQDLCINQEAWQKSAPTKEGSWWIEWQDWLSNYSDPNKVLPPSIGNAKKGYHILYDAPGDYVLQK